MAKPTVVKNRRLKVSPGGIITLPVAARKSLQMKKGEGSRVTVAVDKKTVSLSPANKTGGFRVSPAGQFELRGKAREILSSGPGRHFWIELDDDNTQVRLKPF